MMMGLPLCEQLLNRGFAHLKCKRSFPRETKVTGPRGHTGRSVRE